MMSKKQISDLILLIAVEFPKDIDLSEKALKMKVGLWHDVLKNYEYNALLFAVTESLKSLHFCPKLSDITAELTKLENAFGLSAEQYWSEIEKALIRASYLSSSFHYTYRENGKETQGELARKESVNLYEKLPDSSKAFFGNYSTFMKVALLDDLQFEKARFLRRFEELRQRLQIRITAGELKQIGALPLKPLNEKDSGE
jgi:hypothetical protein